ncbi:MAG: glycosyltransferase [Candidatus Taylorbacteria bacterium]|nr:glycosyltransferase [Candidatus Taylorbacteria bacterium]
MENGRPKQKILYLITKSNWGGAQRYVYDLATHIPKERFESAVAFGGSGALKAKLEAASVQTIVVPDLERNVSLFKEARAFLNILRIIKEVKPGIIHLNSPKAGGLGALAARLYNLAVSCQLLGFRLKSLISNSLLTTKSYKLTTVFTVHGWTFKEKRKSFVKKMIEYASWLTVLLSHRTILVSNNDRGRARRFLFVQSKISVIHNGIEMPVFKDKDEARQILVEKIGQRLADKTFWVGSVAELHKNKGLEYGINALALIKNQKTIGGVASDKIAYVILGGGEERTDLELLIEREGLTGSVFLAGEYAGAAELLKAFDVFLLPSLKEGLPYALLEAGLAGLPAIATNVGGVPEIIEDMKSGIIIKEKRSKEIADALCFLLEHPEKRREFGERLIKTIETSYTIDRMIKETVAVYENC